jgi:hypothetical protein
MFQLVLLIVLKPNAYFVPGIDNKGKTFSRNAPVGACF